MKLKSLLIPSSLILVTILSCVESQKLQRTLEAAEIAKISSALTRAEPRQLGILGFAALGAMMFPILVSLGMASFVSHLPTVFKEFATEFGIPSTPPRNLYLFRRKRSDFSGSGIYEDRWLDIIKALHSSLVKTLEEQESYKYFQKH